jgi:hypothetical protein
VVEVKSVPRILAILSRRRFVPFDGVVEVVAAAARHQRDQRDGLQAWSSRGIAWSPDVLVTGYREQK